MLVTGKEGRNNEWMKSWPAPLFQQKNNDIYLLFPFRDALFDAGDQKQWVLFHPLKSQHCLSSKA